MRNLVLLFSLLILGLTSCQKENIEPSVITQVLTDTVYVEADCPDSDVTQNYYIVVTGLSSISGSIYVNGVNSTPFSFERYVQSGDLVEVYANSNISNLATIKIWVNNNLVYDSSSFSVSPGLLWSQTMP